MFPRPSNDRKPKGLIRNPKSFRFFFDAELFNLPLLPHFQNCGICKLRKPHSFPECESLFERRIFGVIQRSSKKEVVNPDAWRVVAIMAYTNSTRNLSIHHFPMEFVGNNGPLSRVKKSIPIFVFAALPDPAPVPILDHIPKAINRWACVARLKFTFAGNGAANLFSAICVENGTALRTIVLEHKKLILSVFRGGVGVMADALVCLRLSKSGLMGRCFCG